MLYNQTWNVILSTPSTTSTWILLDGCTVPDLCSPLWPPCCCSSSDAHNLTFIPWPAGYQTLLALSLPLLLYRLSSLWSLLCGVKKTITGENNCHNKFKLSLQLSFRLSSWSSLVTLETEQIYIALEEICCLDTNKYLTFILALNIPGPPLVPNVTLIEQNVPLFCRLSESAELIFEESCKLW